LRERKKKGGNGGKANGKWGKKRGAEIMRETLKS